MFLTMQILKDLSVFLQKVNRITVSICDYNDLAWEKLPYHHILKIIIKLCNIPAITTPQHLMTPPVSFTHQFVTYQ